MCLFSSKSLQKQRYQNKLAARVAAEQRILAHYEEEDEKKAAEDERRIRRYADLQTDYEIRNAQYDNRLTQILREIEHTRGTDEAIASYERVRSWQPNTRPQNTADAPARTRFGGGGNVGLDYPRFSSTVRDAYVPPSQFTKAAPALSSSSAASGPIVVSAPPVTPQNTTVVSQTRGAG